MVIHIRKSPEGTVHLHMQADLVANHMVLGGREHYRKGPVWGMILASERLSHLLWQMRCLLMLLIGPNHLPLVLHRVSQRSNIGC